MGVNGMLHFYLQGSEDKGYASRLDEIKRMNLAGCDKSLDRAESGRLHDILRLELTSGVPTPTERFEQQWTEAEGAARRAAVAAAVTWSQPAAVEAARAHSNSQVRSE